MPPPVPAERLAVAISGKRREGRAILGRISFSVGVGEIVAVSGPSGCGKTTLINIVAGLDRDFDGSIAWQGSPRLGVSFQSPRLLPWKDAAENVALVIDRPADEARRLAVDSLDRLGLAGAASLHPAQLSLGMAARVSLARALAVLPDMLLLDEVFASLDDACAESARALIARRVREQGMSVLMISHDKREIDSFAHRHLCLSGHPAALADIGGTAFRPVSPHSDRSAWREFCRP